jgi:hypothetical protein
VVLGAAAVCVLLVLVVLVLALCAAEGGWTGTGMGGLPAALPELLLVGVCPLALSAAAWLLVAALLLQPSKKACRMCGWGTRPLRKGSPLLATLCAVTL